MNNRFFSLDVFRGATVALMILVNNPGSWSHIFSPLDHAEWQGCTPTDLVFPFFLFAVGNAMAFVMPRFQQNSHSFFFKKVIKRALLIFTIGLLLNWCPFFVWDNNQLVFKQWAFINKDALGNSFEDGVRLLGVLQRIAICYFFAAVIAFYFKPKTALIISIAILLIYWILCCTLGTNENPYSLTGFFGNNIDISIIGKHHLLHADKVNDKVYHFDYEGLTSSIAAIVQVLFGYFVGYYIQKKGKTYEMLANLFVAGCILLVIGYWWDMVFPISKKMWTSSYTVYTTGLAIVTIAVMIYLIEFKNIKGIWAKFFDVFGKNPLFIFVLSGFLPRVLKLIRIADVDEAGKAITLNPLSWFYEHICKHVASDLRIGSLLYAIILIFFYWAICYLLDKKRIYIKV
ncbi:MAG: acyltransferase family protein [Chitinophagaceae bacterium]